jgi:hypothetical protein
MSLKLDLNVARGGIDEDAASRVHVLGFCLAAATEEATLCRADEMVDRDALAREDLILPKYICTVANDAALSSWSGTLPLLGELASCAHRWVDETGAGCVEPSGAFRGCQSAALHQELDAPEREVSETIMPAQQLLLGVRKVGILSRNSPWWRWTCICGVCSACCWSGWLARSNCRIRQILPNKWFVGRFRSVMTRFEFGNCRACCTIESVGSYKPALP